ncbi:MAG TPA: peroxidase-related enzyme [Bryobacteraceae bacterium]|nr:peroxidase-related enzyme [Bryobacteraceae bacterium]
MALIPLVEPAQNEYLAELESKGKRENRFFRLLAHKPEALKHFLPLYGAIMGPGLVDRRTKELAYLSASMANECAYCTAAHRATGRKAGITDEEMRAIETQQYQDFSPADRAVIQYARELTSEADAAETAEGLFRNFNDEQVVEITLVVAMANFTNRLNNGLDLEPEG